MQGVKRSYFLLYSPIFWGPPTFLLYFREISYILLYFRLHMIIMARLTIVRGPYRFCPVRACIFCFHRKWYLWVSKRLLVLLKVLSSRWCPSVRPSVRPSVHPSVRPSGVRPASVRRPSVRPSVRRTQNVV